MTKKEALALEAEIIAQIMACERQGLTPTHLDSHHHIHTEWGIAPVVIRSAKRCGIGIIRLAQNCHSTAAAIIHIPRRLGIGTIRPTCDCGPGRESLSVVQRVMLRFQQYSCNTRLRLFGLARTEYFGNVQETAHILKTTNADVEVMVHPRLDICGRLVDLDGENLESRITALRILSAEMCSFYGL